MNGKFAQWSLSQLLTVIMIFAAGSAFAAGETLLHNSDTVGTKYGTWGVAGGTYGAFTCTTCHSSATTGPNGNIKKIVSEIPDTIGPNANKPVVFNNLTGFGDDSVAHATSTKICEVCHTQTTAHQYNTANAPQSGNLSHANGDCTQCHSHADGFKASGHLVPLYATAAGHTGCSSSTGCHTNTANPLAPYPVDTGATPLVPPDCRTCHAKADPLTVGIGCGSCHGDAGGNGKPSGPKSATLHNWSGSHTVHTAQAACTECHTSGGTGGNADHGRGNRDTNLAVVNLNATYGWTGTTCNTASCHANPYVVDAYVAAPAWGSKNNGCSACHSEYPIGTNGPATGSHSFNGHKVACTNCHEAGTTYTSVPSTNHANANVDVVNVGYPTTVAKHAAGSGYSTCSAASCHANVYGSGYVATPAWGSTPSLGCSVCHTQTITANGPDTGSHAKHAGKACTSCHNSGTTSTTAPNSAHIDGNIDITITGYAADITNIAKHAAGSGYGTCSNISCHTPGTTTPSNSLTWGVAANCNTCHPKISLSGAHQVHMGALDLTSASVYYNMTANRTPAVSDTTRQHGFGCAECHPMDKATYHLNGVINVDLNRVNVAGVGTLRFLNHSTAAYDMGATKKCSNIYCHSNASRLEAESNVKANTSLAWTDTFAAHPEIDRCAACHGNQPTTGAHAAHSVGIHTFNNGEGSVLEGNIYNGKSGKVPITNKPNTAHGNPNNSTTLGCYICHNATVTSSANDRNTRCVVCHYTGNPRGAALKGNAAIGNLKNHVNGTREIAFLPIKVLSKAQIRPKNTASSVNTTFDHYSGVWVRNTYKNMSTLSFDTAKAALDTATMWHPSSPTESNCTNIACHNGKVVKWNLANFNDPNKCMDCHNAL